MSSGLFQASQTLAIGALTAVSTVIFTAISCWLSLPPVSRTERRKFDIHFIAGQAAGRTGADSAAIAILVVIGNDDAGEPGRDIGTRRCNLRAAGQGSRTRGIPAVA